MLLPKFPVLGIIPSYMVIDTGFRLAQSTLPAELTLANTISMVS